MSKLQILGLTALVVGMLFLVSGAISISINDPVYFTQGIIGWCFCMIVLPALILDYHLKTKKETSNELH